MAKNRSKPAGGGVAEDVAKPAPAGEPAVPTAAPAPAADDPTLAAPPASPAAAAANKAAEREVVVVHVEVICGGLTNVKAPVAVAGHYMGLPLAGAPRAFDQQLDSWLTRAIDLGMVSAGLGQIFPLDLRPLREAEQVNVDRLLLAGMGKPGTFAQDDLRYLMSNVTVAVKSLAARSPRDNEEPHDHLSITLLGTYRNEMLVEDAVRGLLEGICDGYERFRAISDAVTRNREGFQNAAERPLFVSLVTPDKGKAVRILASLREASQESIDGLEVHASDGGDVPPDADRRPRADDTDPDVVVTMLRVTRKLGEAPPAAPAPLGPTGMPGTELFQFSALSERSVVTVREVELSSYLVGELACRMKSAANLRERETFGRFFTTYLIPDDFRRLAESESYLTLVVDETTATYPWEMAARTKYAKVTFLGTSAAVSRQFHTLLAPPPSSPPPLNDRLNVLIIADPTPGFPLPHAREEGLAVLGVLDCARQAWGGAYRIEAKVRLGPRQEADALTQTFDYVRARYPWVTSVEPCDPLELAALIVDEQFDVIHYAGHGAFDPKTARAAWAFSKECFLSAEEIFRVRQVPRLVFANACFSAVTGDRYESRGQLVGLAKAFFARGIPNYIGTGWQVSDAAALECARWFYATIFGLQAPDDKEVIIDRAPPAIIGRALLEGRRRAFRASPQSATWGAYQHYGHVGDKLLPVPNASRMPEAV